MATSRRAAVEPGSEGEYPDERTLRGRGVYALRTCGAPPERPGAEAGLCIQLWHLQFRQTQLRVPLCQGGDGLYAGRHEICGLRRGIPDAGEPRDGAGAGPRACRGGTHLGRVAQELRAGEPRLPLQFLL